MQKKGNHEKNSFLISIIFVSVAIIAQTKKIQLFTGAITIENGIRYNELEIKVNDELLRTADIPLNEKLSGKLIPTIPQLVLL